MNKKDKYFAVVQLSGGLDSTVCLFHALNLEPRGSVHCVTFDYGQVHDTEIASAAKVVEIANKYYGGRVTHEVIKVPAELLSSASPLLDKSATLERYGDVEEAARKTMGKVATTFVPMRNTLFTTIAVNRAVKLYTKRVYLGICGTDTANYPDCTSIYKEKLAALVFESLPSGRGPLIVAPLIRLTKKDTVEMAASYDGCFEALAYSHTSYDGKFPPTDKNHANLLRAEGFELAGYPDPLVLRAVEEGLMELPKTPNYEQFKKEKQ